MVTATCAGCGTTFEAPTRRRKWCNDACKVRTHRENAKAARSQPEPPDGAAEGAPTSGREPKDPLVTAVRAELEATDAVDTVDGQIALHLAAQVRVATGSAAASLAKELRTVLDRVTPPAPPRPDSGAGKPESEEDDPATKARKAREAKVAAAAAEAEA